MKHKTAKEMLEIELIPDITHCIETVAKREYMAVSRRLLASIRSNKELREKLEVLRLFLETADFKQLRAESEGQLMKGKQVKFTIYLDTGVPKHKMHVI